MTSYPKDVQAGDKTFTLSLMGEADVAAVLAFARAAPAHDLLFMPRDITNEKVVKAWAGAIASDAIVTVLAYDGTAVVGCVGLFIDPLSWSPHVAELRALVLPDARATGLGRLLIQEAFRIALERDMKKITAQMTVDQKGAVAIFEELGFGGEALLKEHVVDQSGQTHDIVILSCDVERVAARKSAYSGG